MADCLLVDVSVAGAGDVVGVPQVDIEVEVDQKAAAARRNDNKGEGAPRLPSSALATPDTAMGMPG